MTVFKWKPCQRCKCHCTTAFERLSTWFRHLEHHHRKQALTGLRSSSNAEQIYYHPNNSLMRAVLDKLATLKLPNWLTEIDISRTLSLHNQATYLEEVLREGFSHPSMHGIMLWTTLDPGGSCYKTCLTDTTFKTSQAETL